MKTLILDTEVFWNYYLVAFRNVDTCKVTTFEMREGEKLDVATIKKILAGFRIVTFNGIHYDLPLLSLALEGADCKKIKKASDAIIKQGLKHWQFYQQFGCNELPVNHVDLIELAIGRVSLKVYGGRLHAPKLQDCPVDFEAPLPEDMIPQVRDYCVNDLETTERLFEKLLPQIELREEMGEEYQLDLRSKSDAQIAEAVIKSEIEEITGKKAGRNPVEPGTEFMYDVPHWVTFNTPAMREVLEIVKRATFKVTDKGAVEMPVELAGLTVEIGEGRYRMGIGGLHSTEESHSIEAIPGTTHILDRDVASYYPNLIVNCGIYPEHLGPIFLEVYGNILKRRLAAKRGGNTVMADVLKIVLNGTFGKLGTKYSVIYSPKLMIQVTMTGQLALLMLIEDLNEVGIEVVSANTDGVTSMVHAQCREPFTRIVEAWELNCGLETEEKEYRQLHSRDVNNYLAIKMDGSTKGKGVYADEGLSKNPQANVCTRAVVEFLRDGRSIESTICSSTDIREFVVVRGVKGGGMFGEEFLGKAVRWYYSTKTRDRCIQYKTNGNKVAGSDGAQPCMQLPESFPSDVDFNWYVAKARAQLKELGVEPA